MRLTAPSILLAVTFLTATGLNAQTLKKVKVKTFVDKSGNNHSPYLFNAVSVADNGSIIGLYPAIDAQPDWIKEKKGYTTPTAVHTWDRAKATRQVKSEPYLVYGRDQVEPLGLMRLGKKSYLIGYQGKTTGGSAVVYSQLKGSGITASPCQELVTGDLVMNLKERPTNEPQRGLYKGVRTYTSATGNSGLISLVGDIKMDGANADIVLVSVDKEMNVVWTEAFELADAGSKATVLDVQILGEDDALVLTSISKSDKDGAGGKEIRLYRRSSKDFLEIDFEGDVVQDAEMNVDGDKVHIAGIYGNASDKKDRTFGGFHLTVLTEDMEIAAFNEDKFSEPAENTVLAGVDRTDDGRTYVTTATYSFEGTKAGAGGSQLKNITYHCTALTIFHFESNGSHARTTRFPMANAGASALEVMPLTVVFQDDLMVFYNEDPANAEKRKKGGELDPEKSKADQGAQYTQLTFDGAMYSRIFLKEDAEVRSIFPIDSWEIGKGELFLMGIVNAKNPTFYPIKIQLTPSSS